MQSSEIFVHAVQFAVVLGFPLYATIIVMQVRKYLHRRRQKAWAAKHDAVYRAARAERNAIMRTLPTGSFWDNQSQKWYIAFQGTHIRMSGGVLKLGLRCLGLDREKEST